MDPQTQNQAPSMTPPQEHEKNGVGGMIGIVIIVIILIVAGVYLFANRTAVTTPPTSTNEATGTDDQAAAEAAAAAANAPSPQTLETQSSSDNMADIEADLNNTDLNNMDAEMNGIQSEVSAGQSGQ